MLSNVEDFVIHQDAQGLYEAFESIPEKPDVLLCSNDELAVFFMRTLQGKGIHIPSDLGIVGFDDIELSSMVSPALTDCACSKEDDGKAGNAASAAAHISSR